MGRGGQPDGVAGILVVGKLTGEAGGQLQGHRGHRQVHGVRSREIRAAPEPAGEFAVGSGGAGGCASAEGDEGGAGGGVEEGGGGEEGGARVPGERGDCVSDFVFGDGCR